MARIDSSALSARTSSWRTLAASPADGPDHEHAHDLLVDAVVPTPLKVEADPELQGSGVSIAFLDSGFFPHPDLVRPRMRIAAYHDVTAPGSALPDDEPASWAWHGTMTSVVAAGNGLLSDGVYRGIAAEADVVLVKVSDEGRISEENIAAGLRWVLEHRERLGIRVVSISLGGDADVPVRDNEVDRLAEACVAAGLVVVVAAGNSGASDRPNPVPPANAPSVVTVGGYDDGNEIAPRSLSVWRSSFGTTADGYQKPELLAPSIWVAAPILPRTDAYRKAEVLSHLAGAPNFQLRSLVALQGEAAGLPRGLETESPAAIRRALDEAIASRKVVATHYQHVDGTSFAAPIVASIVAQMLQANPRLSPAAVKRILIANARRIAGAPAERQGWGIVDARRATDAARCEPHGADDEATGPRVDGDALVIGYHDDAATSVGLAGDFNGWDASRTPFRREGGIWKVSIPRPAGESLRYKLVVDETRWLEDPSNGMKEPDGHGGFNSVLRAGESR